MSHVMKMYRFSESASRLVLLLQRLAFHAHQTCWWCHCVVCISGACISTQYDLTETTLGIFVGPCFISIW